MHYLFPVYIVVEAGLSLGVEDYGAFLEGEECIVLAHADVVSRENGRAALADYDLAGEGSLSVIDLDPQVLWV